MFSKSQMDDFLHILLPGLSKKPSLLTEKGPVLAPGEDLTLQCCSDISYDRFALPKVGRSDLPQMSAHFTQVEGSHANFTLGSVNFSTVVSIDAMVHTSPLLSGQPQVTLWTS